MARKVQETVLGMEWVMDTCVRSLLLSWNLAGRVGLGETMKRGAWFMVCEGSAGTSGLEIQTRV